MGSNTVSTLVTAIKSEPSGDDHLYPEASEEFVQTPYIREITERALAYLNAGCPVHFAGPAGTGKTTLAFHIAAQLRRPVMLIHGNHEFSSSDLIGKESGYRKNRLVDNFIHSVLREEEELKSLWVDNRLTTCCRNGDTLIYDEFNRSTAEANNVLLSILEEGILNLPGLRAMGEGYLEVNPNFKAIFTSNPQEYAGTHATQDALIDRMVTIKLDYPDRDTEVRVAVAKSGIAPEEAGCIVDIVADFRRLKNNKRIPTVRASIAIARILALKGEHACRGNAFFHRACLDVLCMYGTEESAAGQVTLSKRLEKLIARICPAEKKSPAA
ncbi:gas vesicle protein GvpN [Shewanella salipaludis]|uniref:Gas vesicle protein GvpN n=1 Tax=Shewanella salipaludis TaxID=2723052 RepID=A0A972JLR5_9GAMM|nr:gas vesicle protein GvpN [Shewanella salipaludis]NMH66459.1 gas vesicle protein GvpN [Shewanella salipaludis]